MSGFKRSQSRLCREEGLCCPDAKAGPQYAKAGQGWWWLLLVPVLGTYVLLAPRAGRPENAHKDFCRFWLAGRMILAGEADQLYDPATQETLYRQSDPRVASHQIWTERDRIIGSFFYPPPAAVAYALLAWMPLSTAAVVNAYLNIGLAVGLAWVLARCLDRRLAVPAVALAVLLFPACFITIGLGQNAFWTALIIVLSWCLWNTGRDFAGGVVLGLLVCKPSWLAASAWIPLVHRRWQALFGVVVGAAGAVLVTAPFTGLAPYDGYARLLPQLSALQALPDYNLGMTYNGVSVLRKWFGDGQTADVLAWMMGGGMVLLTWQATRGAWQPGRPTFRRLLGSAALVTLWINPHLFYYDLVLMIVGLLCILLDWPAVGRSARLTGVAILLCGYAALIWDQTWSWARHLPVPSMVILAAWLWHMKVSTRLLRSEAPNRAGASRFMGRLRRLCLGSIRSTTSE